MTSRDWKTLAFALGIGVLVALGSFGPAAFMFVLWLDLRLEQ